MAKCEGEGIGTVMSRCERLCAGGNRGVGAGCEGTWGVLGLGSRACSSAG